MFRIPFALFLLLGVVALECKLHPPARWATIRLAYDEDLQYLDEQGATYRRLQPRGFELKMDAVGYACMQNLRDCQALRVRISSQNALLQSPQKRQRVVRHHETFTAAPDPQPETEPQAIANQQAIDIVLLEIGSRTLTVYEKALTRYEVEHT
ncbi:MAG: hypothetical protein J0I12_01395 [Candidatus Eremiobacteraeota bacterium]|nr:hypothetical protein [Candidatus Eremiobacteraeota bacterium]